MQEQTPSRPPVHSWTEYERLILAVAIRFYNCNTQQLLAIFNALQIDRLRAEGLSTGLPHSSMVSQIADLRITSRGSEFRKVLSMDIETARLMFRNERDTIEAAALNLGIPLQLGFHPTATLSTTQKRNKDSLVLFASPALQLGTLPTEQAPSPTPRPRRQVHSGAKFHESLKQYVESRDSSSDPTYCPSNSNSDASDADVEPWNSYLDSEDTDGEDSDVTLEGQSTYNPRHLDHLDPSGRIPALLRVAFDLRGRPCAVRPRLLFRAFDTAHGLCARRFLDISTPVSGPPQGRKDLRDLFLQHLSEDKTFSSPFLSWAENPRRAMKMICESKHEKTQLSLAVVDYSMLEEEVETRFGRPICIWLVPAICDKFGLNGLRKIHDSSATQGKPKNYTGRGEFLSWGSVTEPAVGILNRDAVLELSSCMECLRHNKTVDYQAGVFMSKYLREISEPYRQIVAYKMIRAFQVRTPLPLSSSAMFRDFVAGVYGDPFGESASMKKVKHITNSMAGPQTNLLNTKGARSDIQSTVSVDIPRRSAPNQKEHSKAAAVATDSDAFEIPEQDLLDAQFNRDGADFGIQVETTPPTDDDVASECSLETDKKAPPQRSDLKWHLVDDHQSYRILNFQSSQETVPACTKSEAATAENTLSPEQPPQPVQEKADQKPSLVDKLVINSLRNSPLPPLPPLRDNPSNKSDMSSMATAAKRIKTQQGAVTPDHSSNAQEEKIYTHKSSSIKELTTSTTTVTLSDQNDDHHHHHDNVEDSDIEIIATRSGTRHLETRFRTHTLLSIRSRSISESRIVSVAAPMHPSHSNKAVVQPPAPAPAPATAPRLATTSNYSSRFKNMKLRKRQPIQ